MERKEFKKKQNRKVFRLKARMNGKMHKDNPFNDFRLDKLGQKYRRLGEK